MDMIDQLIEAVLRAQEAAAQGQTQPTQPTTPPPMPSAGPPMPPGGMGAAGRAALPIPLPPLPPAPQRSTGGMGGDGARAMTQATTQPAAQPQQGAPSTAPLRLPFPMPVPPSLRPQPRPFFGQPTAQTGHEVRPPTYGDGPLAGAILAARMAEPVPEPPRPGTMRFAPDVMLDPSQIEDRRSQGPWVPQHPGPRPEMPMWQPWNWAEYQERLRQWQADFDVWADYDSKRNGRYKR